MKEEIEENTMGALLALKTVDFPTLEKFQKHLTEEWKQNIEIAQELTESTGGARLLIDGQTVVVMYQGIPYPNDLEHVYDISNWAESKELMEQHNAHILVLIMSEANPVEKALLMTKILACLIELTPALGVYKSDQMLLMPAELYILSAKQVMENNPTEVPTVLWVYVGIYYDDEDYSSASGYTYGLHTFGHKEFEANEWSGIKAEEIYDFLHAAATYPIRDNPTLKNETSLGDYFEDINGIAMNFKESKYLEGMTSIGLSLPTAPAYK